MFPAKIYIGQIAVVFGIVIASTGRNPMDRGSTWLSGAA
jgi:hypothetical protein